MEIQYLSNAEAAQFGTMIHSDGELAELFAKMMVLFDADTDYDTVMIGFDDEDVMRIAVEDSPYVIILNERDQGIELWCHTRDGLEFDEQYDFDEDGIETVVDVIASRILTSEYGQA